MEFEGGDMLKKEGVLIEEEDRTATALAFGPHGVRFTAAELNANVAIQFVQVGDGLSADERTVSFDQIPPEKSAASRSMSSREIRDHRRNHRRYRGL